MYEEPGFHYLFYPEMGEPTLRQKLREKIKLSQLNLSL